MFIKLCSFVCYLMFSNIQNCRKNVYASHIILCIAYFVEAIIYMNF